MLLALEVLPVVLRAVGPGLHTLPVLLVIKPLTHVGSTIGMRVGTVTVSFVVTPLALVDVTVGMYEFTESVSLIGLPLAFIFGPVGPDLMSVAVLHPVKPLTGVNCPARQCHWGQGLPLRVTSIILLVVLELLRIVLIGSRLIICLSLIHFAWLTHHILATTSHPRPCICLLILCCTSGTIIAHHINSFLKS